MDRVRSRTNALKKAQERDRNMRERQQELDLLEREHSIGAHAPLCLLKNICVTLPDFFLFI